MRDQFPAENSVEMRRRNMLFVTIGTFVATGTGFAAWSLLATMGPDASVQPFNSDFTKLDLKPGERRLLKLRGSPFMLSRLTEEQIAKSRTAELSSFRDKQVRNFNIESTATPTLENRLIEGAVDYVLFSAVCTHEGCVVTYDFPTHKAAWSCPCCGSVFDDIGRLQSGPAQSNLPIPRMRLEEAKGVVLI